MADPTQIVGTPSLNPPNPNEPGWLADTPQTTDNYDVVINGVGFMLYRGEDNNPPDRIYKTEPVNFTYAPIFIDRANTSGDLGDDQQSFYMSEVQRDWSGGIGQKFFRKDVDPQDRMYWDGSRIQTTSLPGQAKLGGNDSVTTLGTGVGTGDQYVKILAYTQAANYQASGDVRHCLLRFTGNSSTTISYKYSTDGGVTWITQSQLGGFQPNSIVDACLGDDGAIYLLDALSGATSVVHRILGPLVGAPQTWDNSTKITGVPCNCMCFWGGNIYVGDWAGRLRQVANGTSGLQTIIKDFGAGIIVDLLPTPRGIYILYVTVAGEYKLFLYDGTASTQEVARLPRGWKVHYAVEGQTDTVPGFSGCKPRSQQCMCWLDGVLYLTGMLPARDYQQANGLQTPYRTALWYYASGNSGIVWAAETSTYHAWDSGGSGGISVVGNGLVAFPDTMNHRLMAYDPGTAGVVPLATLNQYPSTQAAAGPITVNGTINSLATTLTLNTGVLSVPYSVGDVLQCSGTGELVFVSAWQGVGIYTVVRGYQNTTPSDLTFVNNHTVTVSSSARPTMWGMAYSAEYDRLVIPWEGWEALDSFWGNQGGQYNSGFTIVDLRPGPDFGGAVSGVLATSKFDFDSSLPKYFKDVMWDGDLAQFPNLTTETAGTVDLYYCVDGIASATTDTGVVLVQAGAVPGTRYPVGATGRTLQLLAVLNAPSGSSSHPISQGPIINWLSVRGAPIMPGYRSRTWQIALFNDIRTKQGFIEPRSGTVLRRNLETLMATGAPVTVSDAGMTNVLCIIEADKCLFREMKPSEYVAYVEVREV